MADKDIIERLERGETLEILGHEMVRIHQAHIDTKIVYVVRRYSYHETLRELRTGEISQRFDQKYYDSITEALLSLMDYKWQE